MNFIFFLKKNYNCFSSFNFINNMFVLQKKKYFKSRFKVFTRSLRTSMIWIIVQIVNFNIINISNFYKNIIYLNNGYLNSFFIKEMYLFY